MTGLIIGGVITIIVAFIGGIAGVVKFMEFLQSNAQAHTDVKALQREIAKMQERERDMNDRLVKMEEKMEQVGKDNSILTEKNFLLIKDNGRLIEQNGKLISMVHSDDDTESAGDD